jgi:hypothetical protein
MVRLTNRVVMKKSLLERLLLCVNRIGFFSLRSKDQLDYQAICVMIHVLLRGAYPSLLSKPSIPPSAECLLFHLSAPANKFASLPNKKAIQLR